MLLSAAAALLAVASCCLLVASPAGASSTASRSRALLSTQGPSCTAVPGESTTQCRNRGNCLVCQDSVGVPQHLRPCLCCPPGRIPNPRNLAACGPCLRGSIAPDAGSLQCQQCPEGSTTAKGNRTACAVCRPGYGGTSCTKCTPDSWSAGGPAAVTLCQPCPANKRSAAAGAISADNCTISELGGPSAGHLLCLP